MLRQAVKTCLKKQNRLSFSSLQVTVRKIQTLNSCKPQIIRRRKRGVFEHYLCMQNFHATGIWLCTVKNGNSVVENKGLKDCDVTHENVEVLFDGKKEDNVAKSLILNKKNKIKSTDIEKLYGIDTDEERVEALFDSDAETSEVVLVPIKGREKVKRIKNYQAKSLIDPKNIYKPKSVIRELVEKESGTLTRESAEFEESILKYNLEQAEKGNLKVSNVQKVTFPQLKNVAPIVNDTKVLKKMVDLGVSLWVVQKKGMIDHVLNMNFEKDVVPYILFLKDTGIPAEKIGDVFTECPWIFQHDVHNLHVRVNYLRSKKFSKSQVIKMIDCDPRFLLIPMDKIDAKLGFLQREFQLTGAEVRKIASDMSKLIIAKPVVIKENKFFLKKSLEFTENELKTLLLSCPEVYLRNFHRVEQIYNYIHDVMEIPQDLIVKFGKSLITLRYTLDTRHRFLVKLGKNQYDPTKPNYVSLYDIIVEDDEEFCKETAKTAVAEFNAFLRLI
ncbi:transcription termination factor 3, mitochondrial-like [Ruditapes philippinarum]|uniref:transcription termination factor 3, mitochondrial-like n=1 Tax=Ruditapes philippinarum TaxID=129788 RepID=UPI00295BB423|nr:transcription termination factor 3, mitochondrial-like [Ruditapes philippinarum]